MNAHMTFPLSKARTFHFIGSLLTFRAGAADTDGAFSLVECRTAPGAGSPPHYQDDAEAFYVTEGHYEFTIDGKKQLCGPGDFAYVKPGVVHMFANADPTPSSMLIINLPGGPHEEFFMKVGDELAFETTEFPAPSAPDIPFIVAAAAEHGVTILPPPGA